jgi:predicted acylesterase/phospholipase RssA
MDFETALGEELAEIEHRRGDPAAVAALPPDAQAGDTQVKRAARLKLSALCLSGGGIRSAAFGLGVLQSLAAKRLLNRFDYLSTVSGGGFIGGWLQMLLHATGDVEQAQEELATSGEAVKRLRHYTNYLTPHVGPFSSDTWASVALYARNLLLNWMIFTPLFLLVALLPISFRTFIAVWRDDFGACLALLAIGGVALVVVAWQGCALAPSHRTIGSAFASSRAVFWRIAAPSLIWVWAVPAAIEFGLASLRFAGESAASAGCWLPIAIAAVYFVAMVLGYFLAALLPNAADAAGDLYGENVLRWLAASACAAGLVWLGIHLILPTGPLYYWAAYFLIGSTERLLVDTESALALLFPPWLIVTHVLQTTFYVGFRKDGLIADIDREWLARLSGILLRIAIVWAVVALCALILPRWLHLVGPLGLWERQWMSGAALGTTGIGALAAWLGKRLAADIEAVAKKANTWNSLILGALGVAYGIGLLVVAGSALQYGLGWIHDFFLAGDPRLWPALAIQIAVAALFVGLVVLFGHVNVNRFSLHAVYRNRLSRAFLGAARPARNPDPFTGFDQRDNPRLELLAAAAPGQRLFPVINITLNVTAGNNAALAERKADSFTATPLACGAAALGGPNCYVPTTAYAGRDGGGDERGTDRGLRLGAALTISGAALSPNWGYHSSPVTAFLMTLFNVRLGAWLPNPAKATADELTIAKPRNSILALLEELVGASTDSKQAVYLSDGGHFENLGIYEMLRRRCRWIVAVDAGEDADCALFDLGNAIRKAAIDFSARVEMRGMKIFSRADIEKDKAVASEALGVAIGDIFYDADTEGKATGHLIYIKPSFLRGIPADVRAFGNSDASFPHDSTAGQWFTESQFESYRALGKWQMDEVIGAMPGHDRSVEGLFDAAERICGGGVEHNDKKTRR